MKIKPTLDELIEHLTCLQDEGLGNCSLTIDFRKSQNKKDDKDKMMSIKLDLKNEINFIFFVDDKVDKARSVEK